MNSDFAAWVAELQDLGFLQNRSVAELWQGVERTWGLDLPGEAESPAQADLMLVSLDREQAWHQDLKHPDNHFERLVGELSRLARGAFNPSNLVADLEQVSFQVGPYSYRFQPAPGHYLDMQLLKTLNSSLLGANRFEVCDNLGMPNVVLFLEPERRDRLQAMRGWSFVPSLVQPADGFRWGFLSNYFEQGMEEAAWLTFQDQRFCASLEAGWQMEGLHRIGPGDSLQVLRDDGSLAWQGRLQMVRGGFWQRLRGQPATLKPPEIEPEVWHDWFHRSPPWRALYLPGAR